MPVHDTTRSAILALAVAGVVVSCGGGGGGSSTAPLPPSNGGPSPTSGPSIAPKSTSSPRGTATPSSTPTPSAFAGDWSGFGYDLERTGYDPNFTAISTASVRTMHALWSNPPNVGYYVNGEPVLAMGVNVGGVLHNILYAGSGTGKFYAIDADSGSVIWSRQLGSTYYTCGIQTQDGVKSTPALDRARNRVYIDDGLNDVWALDLATGANAQGWSGPVSIDSNTGHDFTHGAVTYNPADNIIYAETSSTCDISPWYGRITAISAIDGHIIGTFLPTQSHSGGSIWGFGGASIDPATSDVFVATGNADTTDGTPQNAYYAEQIVELSPDLSTVIAHNNPPNMPVMFDADFGSTPMLFQPIGCPPMLAAINKSGVLVLYNRTNINAGPMQMLDVSVADDEGDFIGVPAYDPVTNFVYVGLPATYTSTYATYRPGAAAFSVTSSCTLNPTPVWNAQFGEDGAGNFNILVQRSPITIANGVVYISERNYDHTYALDAATGSMLWSAQLGDLGIPGPIVGDGHLYVTDFSGSIRAWSP